MDIEKRWLKIPAIARKLEELVSEIKRRYLVAEVDQIMEKIKKGFILNPFILEKSKEEWKRALAGITHFAYMDLSNNVLSEILDKYKKTFNPALREMTEKMIFEIIGAAIKTIDVLGRIEKMHDYVGKCIEYITKLMSELEHLGLSKEKKLVVNGLFGYMEKLDLNISMSIFPEFISNLVKYNQYKDAEMLFELIRLKKKEISSLIARGTTLWRYLRTLNAFAELFLKEGKLKKAEKVCLEAIEFCQKTSNQGLQAICVQLLTTLALIKCELECIPEALEFIEKALRLFEEMNNKKIEYDPWNYIWANYVKALILYKMKHLNEALAIIKRIDDDIRKRFIKEKIEEVISILELKAKVLAEVGEKEEALGVLSEIEQIISNYGNKLYQLKLMLIQARIYRLLNQNKRAREIIDNGIKLCCGLLEENKWRISYFLCEFLMEKAILLETEKKIMDALEYLDKAEERCWKQLREGREEHRILLLRILRRKAELYRKLGDEKKAKECYQKLLNLIDC